MNRAYYPGECFCHNIDNNYFLCKEPFNITLAAFLQFIHDVGKAIQYFCKGPNNHV